MTDSPHPDDVERVRAALWGAGAEASREAEQHLAACPGCSADVEFYRRVRATFVRHAAAEVPLSTLEAARTAAQVSGPGAADLVWFPVTPVPGIVGTRTVVSSDVHVTWSSGDTHVDVLLHPTGTSGCFALSGQVLGAGSLPAAGADVTLYVDRRRAEATSTDEFGEFAFGARRGSRFGLALGAGAARRHVEVWANGGPL